MRRYKHFTTLCKRKLDARDCVNALHDACEFIADKTKACPQCREYDNWKNMGGSDYCSKTCIEEPAPDKHVDCWMGYFYLMQKGG